MTPSAAPAVQIRSAAPADDQTVAHLIHASPLDEAAGIAGGAERASAIGIALFEAGVGRTPRDEAYLAMLEGRPVGVLLARVQDEDSPIPLRALPGLLRFVLRLYRPAELPGLVRRIRMRRRLDFPIPPGSFHVAELHVDPRHRGRAIGTALLRHAEDRAAALGCSRLNLATATANPARRLYERLGFEQTGEHSLPGYEAITGTTGRVFYEKRIAPAP